MVYIAVILLLFVLIYIYDYKKKEGGKILWLVVVAIILTLIGGLRYRIGVDQPNYILFYKSLNPLDSLTYADLVKTRYAPGFMILASFTKLFTKELILLQLIQSAFVCGVITWFFYRNSKNPFFSLLLFFFFLYTLLVFEQIREAVSVAIFLLAWSSFRKGNWLIWYALAFCALAFHASAIMMFFLPAICLPGVRQIFVFGKRTWILCAGVLVLAFAIQAVFFRYIELISFTESTTEMTAKYENTSFGKANLNINGIVGVIFRSVLYPFMAMYFLKYKTDDPQDESSRILRKDEMLALMSIYISIFSICVPIVNRYNNYFFFFSILLMSDWIFDRIRIMGKAVKLDFVYWIILFVPLLCTQTYLSYMTNLNKSGTLKNYVVYYPYASYIDKDIDANREKAFYYMRRKRI